MLLGHGLDRARLLAELIGRSASKVVTVIQEEQRRTPSVHAGHGAGVDVVRLN